ncbi:MAG: hypothetical protein JRN06_04285 [Nitrososphaerota archaeon]|nr:hypothetical protein [Nitrososphaerota archaeon]MDG7023839.1 hypothetical protein [Nitrososphaerota archaeon]
MKSGETPHRLQVVWALALILLAGAEAPAVPTKAPGQTGAAGHAYPSTSWAVGLVVPEGASLQGGGKLRWEAVSILTAAVTLPEISLPDEIVYAVLSVMTSNGSVLQAAAGIRPNDSSWSAYAWLIPSTVSVPLVYQWILNASGPTMAPGANISISIYQTLGTWNLRVSDEQTGAAVTQRFPSGIGSSLRPGDQEVFALESYSRSGATFQNMGNLTLTGIFLDGSKATGGVYAYSDWDPAHNPLFAVGSSGASPPSFISFGQAKDGSFVWGYAMVWTNPTNLPLTVAIVAAMVLAAICTVGVALWRSRKATHPPEIALISEGQSHL